MELNTGESFYAGAMERIRRFMLVVAVSLTAACWVRFGWRLAFGLAAGCAIGYLNFYWLKRVVTALADKVTNTHEQQSGSGVFLRFLLRYLLIALTAFVILKLLPASLYGLLAGLFLPVAGIMCEGVYEVYIALRRGV